MSAHVATQTDIPSKKRKVTAVVEKTMKEEDSDESDDQEMKDEENLEDLKEENTRLKSRLEESRAIVDLQAHLTVCTAPETKETFKIRDEQMPRIRKILRWMRPSRCIEVILATPDSVCAVKDNNLSAALNSLSAVFEERMQYQGIAGFQLQCTGWHAMAAGEKPTSDQICALEDLEKDAQGNEIKKDDSERKWLVRKFLPLAWRMEPSIMLSQAVYPHGDKAVSFYPTTSSISTLAHLLSNVFCIARKNRQPLAIIGYSGGFPGMLGDPTFVLSSWEDVDRYLVTHENGSSIRFDPLRDASPLQSEWDVNAA